MADYVSGEEKCGDPAPNRASVCALTKGHDGGHRNAWSTAEWPAQPCTYIYGPNGNRCAFANGDEQHDHRTATGLGYVHQDQWRPVQSAVTDLSTAAKVKVWHTGGPGPCTYVYGPGGDRCAFANGGVQHNHRTETGLGYMHQDQWRQWSGVTEDSAAKQLAALQRKVRAQANQINKLEELRRAAVNKQPEHRELADQLRSQVQLTMRENALRRQAETDRDSERKRGDRLLEELRRSLAKSDSTESAERTRRFVDRFYRLASLLGVDTAGETWDTLLQRVADLRAELEVERVRVNARKAELDKLNDRLTGHDAVRMFMGPSAEYGATPLAERVDELAKKLDQLDREVVQRCESRYGDRRCVSYAGHNGAHHDGSGTECWA